MSGVPSVSIVIVFSLGLLGCSTFSGPGTFSPRSQYQPSGNYTTPYKSNGDVRVKVRNYSPGNIVLRWPVRKFQLTQGFSPRRNPEHAGVDMAGLKRSPILAAHPGVVVYAGNRYRGYGKMVILEYSSKWATLYAHMNSLDVETGDRVFPGQVLGRMGRTGRATGVHLHFELLKNKQPVDPMPYLRKQRQLLAQD